MYSTVFWHTPGILCHSTSTHASRFMRGCRYPPEIGGEEGYAKCTSEVTRSGSEHCNLPRVCVDIWGVTLAMDPVEWISWIFVCKIVMCCHPPGGCWLSNTTKGWVSWKKWWLKVGRYAHLLNPFRKQLIKRFRSFQRHKICYSVTPITRKKSFQIILPSDVIIALRGTHGSRGIAETAYLFWFPRGATKCNLVTTREEELNCSLVNCLR